MHFLWCWDYNFGNSAIMILRFLLPGDRFLKSRLLLLRLFQGNKSPFLKLRYLSWRKLLFVGDYLGSKLGNWEGVMWLEFWENILHCFRILKGTPNALFDCKNIHTFLPDFFPPSLMTWAKNSVLSFFSDQSFSICSAHYMLAPTISLRIR